jgi:hypothetical protein
MHIGCFKEWPIKELEFVSIAAASKFAEMCVRGVFGNSYCLAYLFAVTGCWRPGSCEVTVRSEMRRSLRIY